MAVVSQTGATAVFCFLLVPLRRLGYNGAMVLQRIERRFHRP